MAAYREISRAEINAFLFSAVNLAMAKPEYINGGVRVTNVSLNADGIPRLDFDNGDFIFLDFEHLVPRDSVGEPRIADAFRATKGGPTVTDPNRPYCKPDQSCCDFCCGN